MFGLFDDPGFLIPLALVQLLVLLAAVWGLDRYEREPLAVVTCMALWGATVAVAIAVAVREPVFRRFDAADPVVRAMMAALVEEPVKGLALVAALGLSYLVAGHLGTLEFEGVTDGVVYGAAVGLGFAFTEDLFYLVQQESITAGLGVFVDRADFLGLTMLAHAVYSGAFGAGLGLATWERSWTGRIAFPLLGLGAGVLMHATHNGLTAAGRVTATRLADYLFVVAFVAAMVAWGRHQRRVIADGLAPEVERGLIDTEEMALATDRWRSLRGQWRLIRAGEMSELRRRRGIEAELIGLAFTKWRWRRGGIHSEAHPLEEHRRAIRQMKAGAPQR